MTRTGRFLILDPEERRRLHYKYFPGLNLTLALDEAPYRAEFGVGMLKGGHVQTSADSHAVEVRRMTDQPRISFRLTLEGVAQARLSTGQHAEARPGYCMVIPHREGQKFILGPGRRSVLTLEEDAIRDYVRRHYHVDTPRQLSFAEVFKFEGTAFTDVVAMIDLIIDARTCFEEGRSAVHDQLQDTLIAYVVENAPHNFKSRLSGAEHPVIIGVRDGRATSCTPMRNIRSPSATWRRRLAAARDSFNSPSGTAMAQARQPCCASCGSRLRPPGWLTAAATV